MRVRPALVGLGLLALTPIGGSFATTSVASASPVSPAVADCAPATGGAAAARVKKGAKVKEPAMYSAKDAPAYGVVKDLPTLPAGSVTVPTIFHVVQPSTPSKDTKDRFTRLIAAQMKVLNDSYDGTTGGADTAFRFTLDHIDFVVNKTWYDAATTATTDKMKQQLHEGDSETLNVYTVNFTNGLLGYATFPKAYNGGQDTKDGVVILDESMPGGTATRYNGGDTLTHEVGHWFMLYHTFQGGCNPSNDGVTDTPREAGPQFDCDQPDAAYDTCAEPGLDPIHNFMDYTYDACMYEFTPGQADRMSDAWQAFRAGGNG